MRDRSVMDIADCVIEAWARFQNSGVMREPDGRTGNKELDEAASKLDEAAMLAAAWKSREQGGA